MPADADRKRFGRAAIFTAATLLLAGAAPGQTWEELQSEAEEAGVPRREAAGLVARMQSGGLTVAEAVTIVAPVQEAARTGLPAGILVEKATEGVAKGVPPETVAEALRNRVRHLTTARDLVQSHARRRERERARSRLEESLTLALESGLPAEVAANLLRHGAGKSCGQLGWVIEAGESLALGGFDADETEALMMDCLDRDLRRSETLRAVRYSCARRGEGMAFREMRRSLWGNGAAVSSDGGHGRGSRGYHGGSIAPDPNRGTSDLVRPGQPAGAREIIGTRAGGTSTAGTETGPGQEPAGPSGAGSEAPRESSGSGSGSGQSSPPSQGKNQ